jgi:pimeloyl-ACP methyl ester carboxylesterase
MVSVGTHRLHIRTFGTGSPAVVIEHGIGDPGQVWGDVIDGLDRETEVVLYERAGYGRSEPGPMPRSADRCAEELATLLVATPVEPPYILVGHSLGALSALVYASEHPNVVSGVVLLDPPPLEFMRGERFPRLYEMAQQMTAAFRADADSARAAGDEPEAARLEAVASEHDEMFRSGWAQVGSIATLGTLPMVVIASGVPNPGFGQDAEAFQRYWRESSESYAQLSTRGRYVYVPDSTHDLPGDATEEVVAAVRWCMEEAELDADVEAWEGDK